MNKQLQYGGLLAVGMAGIAGAFPLAACSSGCAAPPLTKFLAKSSARF